MILFSFAFEYILKMEYAKLISVDFLLQAPENPRRVSGASCKSTWFQHGGRAYCEEKHEEQTRLQRTP